MKIPCQCPRCLRLIAVAIVREMLGDQNGADYALSQVTEVEIDPSEIDGEGYNETWVIQAVPPVDSESLN